MVRNFEGSGIDATEDSGSGDSGTGRGGGGFADRGGPVPDDSGDDSSDTGSSSSGSDYPNPIADDDPPATGSSDDSRDLGSSVSDDDRDRIQEQRAAEERFREMDPTADGTVSRREARQYLAAAQEAGMSIDNLDERGALAAQIEGISGVDARRLAARRGGRDEADVDLDVNDGVFRTSWREELNEQTRQRRQRQRRAGSDGVSPAVASAVRRGSFGRPPNEPMAMEGGDARLLLESARARGVEGGDVRLLTESMQQSPQGGDFRLFSESTAETPDETGVDFSAATEDPVGFLRGAGPRREERFINALTGGALDEGQQAQEQLRRTVTPGDDLISEADVARGSREFLLERSDELSSAAAVGVASPEPVSTALGAGTLGLLGVAAYADQAEIETPEERPGLFSEVETPDEPQSTPSELGVAEDGRLFDDGEVGVPADGQLFESGELGIGNPAESVDPLSITADRLVQRGRAESRRERERETSIFRRDDRGASDEELQEILGGGGTLGRVEEDETAPENDLFDEGTDWAVRRDPTPATVTAGEIGAGSATSGAAVDDGSPSFAERSTDLGDAGFRVRSSSRGDQLAFGTTRTDSRQRAQSMLDFGGVFTGGSADVFTNQTPGTNVRTGQTPGVDVGTTPVTAAGTASLTASDLVSAPALATPNPYAQPSGFAEPPQYAEPSQTTYSQGSGTPGQPTPPTQRLRQQESSFEFSEDGFEVDATEDLFSSGIQSSEELLEDFGFGISTDGDSSDGLFGSSESGFGSGDGGLFDEGDGWF